MGEIIELITQAAGPILEEVNEQLKPINASLVDAILDTEQAKATLTSIVAMCNTSTLLDPIVGLYTERSATVRARATAEQAPPPPRAPVPSSRPGPMRPRRGSPACRRPSTSSRRFSGARRR